MEPNMNLELQGSNPKLQTVKYVNILPEGKQGQYKQNERVDFQPDPSTNPYFDGKQSYLNIRVRNTSTMAQGNSANAVTAAAPLCFPAHIGANSLINRCLVRARDNAQVIEDIESYNMLNGIKNAYTNDQDIFKTLGRITGVAGRTCQPENQLVDNLACNYFLPNGQTGTGTSSNTITGGSTSVDASFCVPIESGLFSAFGDQHHVIPNLDVPLHLQLFLEKADVALQTLYSRFRVLAQVNGTVVNQEYGKSPFSDHTGVLSAAQNSILIDQIICRTTVIMDDVPYNADMCAFRVGQPIVLGGDTRIITKVETNSGTGLDQIELTFDTTFTTGAGNVTFKLAPATRSYIVDKIELKCLLTIPDEQTMRMIRSQMNKGISFSSVQLYKQSTSEGLVNSVLDIPEALTRCGALLAVPVQQGGISLLDLENSYMYCQPDANYTATNDNQTRYQWQVGGLLLPNLEVDLNTATNNNNDNVIFFNQQVMALRHLLTPKALADSAAARKFEDIDIELPFFYPLSLAPRGESFNIIDSAPQLRIANTSTTSANITPKLYHIFAIHTRILKSSEMGAEISF